MPSIDVSLLLYHQISLHGFSLNQWVATNGNVSSVCLNILKTIVIDATILILCGENLVSERVLLTYDACGINRPF